MRDQIFVSYSHKDKSLLEQIKTTLAPAPALREGKLNLWDDTRIRPGEKWREQIEQALASAKIAVLLVTGNFLASEFIAKQELPPLLKAAEEEGLTVFWIYGGACLYEETPIAAYQAAHDVSKPLSKLKKADREEAIAEICKKLLAVAPLKPPPKKRPDDPPQPQALSRQIADLAGKQTARVPRNPYREEIRGQSTRSIVWLHLSDLHAREKTVWDSHRVLDTLIPDLQAMERKHGLSPNVIFFTGDAAFGGPRPQLQEQYAEVAAFLDTVRNAFERPVPKENIFLVPGNFSCMAMSIRSGLSN